MKDWKLLEKKLVGATDWQRLEEWIFENPSGHTSHITIHNEKDVVVVLGVHKDGRILTIKEYYPALQEKIHTLVAGLHDQNTPEQTTIKELKEEAGCSVEKVTYLGKYTRGKYEEGWGHYLLATGLEEKYPQSLDKDEDIEVVWMERSDFDTLIAKNELQGTLEIGCALLALEVLDKNS